MQIRQNQLCDLLTHHELILEIQQNHISTGLTPDRIYCIPNLRNLFEEVNNDLALLGDWFKANKLLLNVSKTNHVLFHATNMLIKSAQYTLKIGSEIITEKNEVKFVGIILDKNFRWNST